MAGNPPHSACPPHVLVNCSICGELDTDELFVCVHCAHHFRYMGQYSTKTMKVEPSPGSVSGSGSGSCHSGYYEAYELCMD